MLTDQEGFILPRSGQQLSLRRLIAPGPRGFAFERLGLPSSIPFDFENNVSVSLKQDGAGWCCRGESGASEGASQ